MIGATLKIPFSAAIRSRVQILELRPLTTEEVDQLKALVPTVALIFQWCSMRTLWISSLPQPIRSAPLILSIMAVLSASNAEGIRPYYARDHENSLQRSCIAMDGTARRRALCSANLSVVSRSSMLVSTMQLV